MKVSVLLEGDVAPQQWVDKYYGELVDNYPVVHIPHFSTKFITDLPKTLTPTQLRQLINLSFSEEQIQEMLAPRDNFKIYTKQQVYHWLQNRIGRPDSLHISTTWKQFVEKLKKDMEYDSDFME